MCIIVVWHIVASTSLGTKHLFAEQFLVSCEIVVELHFIIRIDNKLIVRNVEGMHFHCDIVVDSLY